MDEKQLQWEDYNASLHWKNDPGRTEKVRKKKSQPKNHAVVVQAGGQGIEQDEEFHKDHKLGLRKSKLQK